MDIKGPAPLTPATAASQVEVTPGQSSASVNPQPQHNADKDSVQLSGLLTLLKVGQKIDVLVAALRGNTMLLQLQQPLQDQAGNLTYVQFRAPLTLPVQVGQTLTLQIVNPDPAQLQLKWVDSDLNAVRLHQQYQLTSQRQQPTAPFYATVAQLNQTQHQATLQQLPAPIREAIQLLWRQLPSPETLHSATQLKHAMQQSGVFTEANLVSQLSSSRSPLVMDLRVTLLRLATALRHYPVTSGETKPSTGTSSPQPANASVASVRLDPSMQPEGHDTAERTNRPAPHPVLPQAQARQSAIALAPNNLDTLIEQLQQLTDTTLARLQSQQVLHVHNDNPRHSLVLELPIRHEDGVDIFDLRILPDAQQQEKPAHEHVWTVMLAFDLEGLGPIRVQINCVHNTISTFWWVEQRDTVELFNQYLETLSNRLKAAGLNIDQMRCQIDTAATLPSAKASSYHNTSIDVSI